MMVVWGEGLKGGTKKKFKIHQKVFAVSLENEIHEFEICDISKSGVITFYGDATHSWHQDLVYPTRNSLIDSQLRYWNSLRL